MTKQYRRIGIVYNARGRDILAWCVTTAFLSLITLGLYLPVAVNRLMRYLCENTEIHIDESQVAEIQDTPAETVGS
jgi:uncharacterized membrane protein YjgN (DUF898 family)